MGRIRQAAMAAVVFLTGVGPLAAQADSIQPGSRVRIAGACAGPAASRDDCAPLIGTILSRTADTLLVRDADGAERSVALDRSVRLSVARPRRRTLAGLGIGAAVGVAAGYLLARSCRSDDPDDPQLCNLSYALTVPAGVGLGAFVGSRFRSTRWVAVPIGGAEVLLGSLRAGGLSLGVGVRR